MPGNPEILDLVTKMGECQLTSSRAAARRAGGGPADGGVRPDGRRGQRRAAARRGIVLRQDEVDLKGT